MKRSHTHTHLLSDFYQNVFCFCFILVFSLFWFADIYSWYDRTTIVAEVLRGKEIGTVNATATDIGRHILFPCFLYFSVILWNDFFLSVFLFFFVGPWPYQYVLSIWIDRKIFGTLFFVKRIKSVLTMVSFSMLTFLCIPLLVSHSSLVYFHHNAQRLHQHQIYCMPLLIHQYTYVNILTGETEDNSL